jgi:hypothetical protein
VFILVNLGLGISNEHGVFFYNLIECSAIFWDFYFDAMNRKKSAEKIPFDKAQCK